MSSHYASCIGGYTYFLKSFALRGNIFILDTFTAALHPVLPLHLRDITSYYVRSIVLHMTGPWFALFQESIVSCCPLWHNQAKSSGLISHYGIQIHVLMGCGIERFMWLSSLCHSCKLRWLITFLLNFFCFFTVKVQECHMFFFFSLGSKCYKPCT